jgi:hypothetical protein
MEAAMLIQGEALSSGVKGLYLGPIAHIVASARLSLACNHNRQKSGLRGRIDAGLTITSESLTRNNPVQP